jgi:predicted RNA binding protein YcfA (HicA-like mRNA interferase family)
VERRELRQRIARRPNVVRFSEAQRVLEAYGWTLARVSGSHHVFVRGSERFAVPFRRPYILPVYVRQILSRTQEQDDDQPDDERSSGAD